MNERPYVNSLGALTGNQAVQQVRAGVPAIYLSGWQVAADANDSLQMYPDQSLYAVSSVPTVVSASTMRCCGGPDPDHGGQGNIDWLAPIVADAESGFGGVLNAFELMKSMIEAGAAGVHYEDQLASVKKCGHMGGKVLVPTQEAVQKLIAARLAADIMGVPTVVLARTDAEAADIVTSDIDENDKPFITGERTSEGFYKTRKGFDQALSRDWRTPSTRTWCGARPGRRTSALRSDSPKGTARSGPRREDAGLQLLAVLQLEAQPRRRHHRQVPARAARWATSSSSSRSPASIRSTTRCSSLRTATRGAA